MHYSLFIDFDQLFIIAYSLRIIYHFLFIMYY